MQPPQEGPRLVPADACNHEKVRDRINSIAHGLRTHTIPVLVVEASSRCNLCCSFCGMHSRRLSSSPGSQGRKRTLPKGHMSLDLFRQVVGKCHDIGRLKVLYLHGNGEPLLNPHIVDFVSIARTAAIAEHIILISNGVCLSREMFMDLVRAGITDVRVSLDAISPERFREIKGSNLAEKVVKNLEGSIELIRAGNLSATLTILCADPDSEDRVLAEEARRVLIHFASQIDGLSNVVIQYRKIFNWVDSINRISDGGSYCRPFPCEQPLYLLMVHCDGDVSMCCADTMKDLVVGNIRRAASLKEILTSDALRNKRGALLERRFDLLPACGYCEVYSIVDRSLMDEREKLLALL